MVSENEGIRTRSKTQAQPCIWNNVPILVKIFKLIVNDLSNDLEAAAAVTDDFVSIINVVIEFWM